MPPSPGPGAATAAIPDGGADFLAYVRTRDRAALERALATATPRAYAQAWKTLGNQADAEDAVQEAVIQLLRGVDRYDGRIPFAAWLGRLVQVACWHQRRQDVRRHRREIAAMSTAAASSTARNDAEVAAQVRSAVQNLGADDRAAIELHYFAGLPQAAAAAALGLREGTLAMRLSRARERLRRLLSERGVALGAVALVGVLSGTSAPAADTAFLERMQAQALNPPAPAPVWRLTLKTYLTTPTGMVLGGIAASALILPSILFWPGPASSASTAAPTVSGVPTTTMPPGGAIPTPPKSAPNTKLPAQETQAPVVEAPPDTSTITLKVKEMQVKDVAKWIEKLTNTTITLVDIPDQMVTVDWAESPLEDALQFLGMVSEATIERLDDRHWRLTGKPSPPKANL